MAGLTIDDNAASSALRDRFLQQQSAGATSFDAMALEGQRAFDAIAEAAEESMERASAAYGTVTAQVKQTWVSAVDAQKFALKMGYIAEEEYYSWLAKYRDENYSQWTKEYNDATLELKKYSDSYYENELDCLDECEKKFDAWFAHNVKMGKLTTEQQIAELTRFAQAYGAEVKRIVDKTDLSDDEEAQLWERAQLITQQSKMKAEELRKDINAGIYDAWERDMKSWVEIHSAYNDWEEIGDSLSAVYDRAIERQKVFFDSGIIGYEEWQEASRKYSLLLYETVSDEYDMMLAAFRDDISSVKEEFADERSSLQTSWAVEDRKEDLSEVRGLISIYKNAATNKGKEYYKGLLETEKQLLREEQLYILETEQNRTLDALYSDYEMMEEAKSKVLAGIRNADLTTARYSGDISVSMKEVRELASAIGEDYSTVGFTSLDMLESIYDTLKAIRKKIGSGSVYNDSRNISIGTGLSQSAVARLINGTIVSGLGTVLY